MLVVVVVVGTVPFVKLTNDDWLADSRPRARVRKAAHYQPFRVFI